MRASLAVLSLALASSSFAIFPDNPSNFPGVGRMMGGSPLTTWGSAVAVTPVWILGARHVGGTVFEQDGQQFNIVQTVNHPSADLRLYRVDRPVNTMTPLKLDLLPSIPTAAAFLSPITVTLAGYGQSGTRIATGWGITSGSEGVRRTARNVVDYFSPNIQVQINPNLLVTSDYLFYDLDDPQGVSPVNILGGPAVGTDEGGIWTWDSGGGWFVQDGGRFKQVATSSIVGAFGGTGVARAQDWGGVGGGVLLQSYATWINGNVQEWGRMNITDVLLGDVQQSSGDRTSLYFQGDSNRYTTRTFVDANDTVELATIAYQGSTTKSPASSLAFTAVGRTNSSLVFVNVKARNWSSNQFTNVGSFWMGRNDQTINLPISNAGPFVNTNGDVRIMLEFFAIGEDLAVFDTSFDMIRVIAQ